MDHQKTKKSRKQWLHYIYQCIILRGFLLENFCFLSSTSTNSEKFCFWQNITFFEGKCSFSASVDDVILYLYAYKRLYASLQKKKKLKKVDFLCFFSCFCFSKYATVIASMFMSKISVFSKGRIPYLVCILFVVGICFLNDK